MDQLAAWGGAIGALAGGGSIIAIVAFWFQRGREVGAMYERLEARKTEVDQRLAAAMNAATLAGGEARMVREQLSDARVEIAREYVSHRDLSAAEARIAGAVEGMRSEMRGLNDRLDRILEKRD